jgi:hypothetical protein
MISKNHRQNHNFQIIYFLVGSCHTPDAAYALLHDLREDRVSAINNYQVQLLRDKSKEIKANNLLLSEDKSERLLGEADLLELKNNQTSGKILYDAAIEEISFIDDCIGKINPSRVYSHLSDSEACQAMQQEEWKLELIHRAENSLLTTGSISPDQFDTMRMHPDFHSEIFPKIKEIQVQMQQGKALEFTNHSLLEDKT